MTYYNAPLPPHILESLQPFVEPGTEFCFKTNSDFTAGVSLSLKLRLVYGALDCIGS